MPTQGDQRRLCSPMSPAGGSCSSGEEDGDAEWRSAIDSVAISAGCLPSSSNAAREDDGEVEKKPKPRAYKLYQVKAQKMLDDLLEKSLEIVKCPIFSTEGNHQEDDEGVRLFRQAPLGIVFNHLDELIGPRKRPRIICKEEIDEKSKKFRRRLRSVVVDGCDVIAAAEIGVQRSLSTFEAKSLEAKAKAKKEEERVAKLKKIRGERWLPSIARAMQRDMIASKKARVVGVVL